MKLRAPAGKADFEQPEAFVRRLCAWRAEKVKWVWGHSEREVLKGIQAGTLSEDLSPENCMQLYSFLE